MSAWIAARLDAELREATGTVDECVPYLGQVFQLRGSAWTRFFYRPCEGDFLQALSEELSTRCVTYEYEDTSEWYAYLVHEKGELLTEYHFGIDYSDEIGVPTRDDRFDVVATADDDKYQFRSSVRRASEAEIQDPAALISRLAAEEGAWLPGWDHIPQPGSGGPWRAARVAPDGFERVDLIVA